MRSVEQARVYSNKAETALRRQEDDNSRMLDDITGMRRDLNDARASGGRVRTLKLEIDNLCADRDLLLTRLDESERENHFL